MAAQQRDARTQHRRETFLWIILPFAGGGLLIAAGVVVAMLLPRRLQVSLLADFLLTILVLCPVVLCLLPLCILLVTAVFGMNRVHNNTAKLMGRAENYSETVSNRAIQTMDTVSRKSIGFNARFAYLDKLWGLFDRKEDEDGRHNP